MSQAQSLALAQACGASVVSSELSDLPRGAVVFHNAAQLHAFRGASAPAAAPCGRVCDACETVAYCSTSGCIPVRNEPSPQVRQQ